MGRGRVVSGRLEVGEWRERETGVSPGDVFFAWMWSEYIVNLSSGEHLYFSGRRQAFEVLSSLNKLPLGHTGPFYLAPSSISLYSDIIRWS
ncbi:hypothetical protein RRG08_028696 [Elysia crispata]|uniref:Uncharacterized protein n=1 Tax=Elysia crispata TaxID=231223 RepID=A0AAE0XNK0_9GAST|nr:hypothetical protein RRG08_028696 [Elysia crispata]